MEEDLVRLAEGENVVSITAKVDWFLPCLNSSDPAVSAPLWFRRYWYYTK